ncbi:MAG: AAA family ATPase [Trueperaceae bacterium]|nr:AAA family ATPase [Trueperaceae bacterium]
MSAVERDAGGDGNSFARVSTGIEGLDDILHGGLPEHGVYLLRGGAGVGKTTLALQFLLDGVARGERCLFVNLYQPTRMLERMAWSHGWSLDGISVQAISPHEALEQMRSKQDVFVPDEVELVDIAARVRALVEEVQPQRFVFDSLSFMEILATVPGRFEQELFTLVELFDRLDVTALFTSYERGSNTEMVADGIIDLAHVVSPHGVQYSRLTVSKVRGSDFLGGEQDYQIVKGGLIVYPRMTPNEEPRPAPDVDFTDDLATGSKELDEIVGGGLSAGTSCLLVGPSGVGKTTLATHYAYAALQRGTKVLFYLFEELERTFLARSAALGMDLRPHIENDLLRVIQVERPSILPGEFATVLRSGIGWGAQLVIVDSLSGYYQAMQSEPLLLTQLRDVVRFMNHRGVISILTLAHAMMPESGSVFPVDISETVDVKIVMQFFEGPDGLHKALTVVKRRDGRHDTRIHELKITSEGVDVVELHGAVGLVARHIVSGRRAASTDDDVAPTG